jgi:serine/threonine protein kinase
MIEIIYPIRSYYGHYVKELDDGILREVATLDALKYDISDIFPSGFQLKKSNDAFIIQIQQHGETLRSLMSKKKILKQHGMNILKLIVVAINKLHLYGYAHRDLTPDNIYVGPGFDEVRLIGFWKSHHKDKAAPQMKTGTMPYWNCQSKHLSPQSGRHDFKSLAIIAMEMMLPVNEFEQLRQCTAFHNIVRSCDRFHPFTRL